jgi:isoprenylcysteine carboxyl methyltransferase (ICMT) family protein YpbQ
MARVAKQQTGWVGWVYFASLMMVLAGGMQIIAGLTAIFNKGFYLVTQQSLIAFNFTTWGWINLILGIVIFCAGLALMSGAMWARVVGSILAIMSALSNLAFLNAYPLWSLIALIVDGFVIYALAVHGSETSDL